MQWGLALGAMKHAGFWIHRQKEPGGMWINRAQGVQALLTEPISGNREFEFKGD